MSKYSCNENFFENIDTEEKAYWLGFLYADGCVHEHKNKSSNSHYEVTLELSEIDRTHIEKFKETLNSNAPVRRGEINLEGKTFYSARFRVGSTKMGIDLINKGCVPRKSLVIKFPTYDIVPKELMKHFIRGYFDGDGCVSCKKDTVEVNFVGTLDFVENLRDFLWNEGVLRTKGKTYTKGNAHEWFFYGVDNSKDFFEYLYKDSTIFLERKYNKFTEFYVTTKRKSTSGKNGVYLDKRSNKWVATIYFNGKRKQLGSFSDKEEAIKVRKQAEIEKCRLEQ